MRKRINSRHRRTLEVSEDYIDYLVLRFVECVRLMPLDTLMPLVLSYTNIAPYYNISWKRGALQAVVPHEALNTYHLTGSLGALTSERRRKGYYIHHSPVDIFHQLHFSALNALKDVIVLVDGITPAGASHLRGRLYEASTALQQVKYITLISSSTGGVTLLHKLLNEVIVDFINYYKIESCFFPNFAGSLGIQTTAYFDVIQWTTKVHV